MSTAGQEGAPAAETVVPATPPAEGSLEASAAAEATPEAPKGTETPPAVPEFDEGKFAATMAENEDLTTALDAANKTIARISKGRTAEHETRQPAAAPAEPKAPVLTGPEVTTTQPVDPDLASLPTHVDTDGQRFYQLHGMNVTAEFAKAMLGRDVGDRVGALETAHQQGLDRQAAADAKATYDRVMTVAGASIADGCKDAFPTLQGEVLNETSRIITQLTANAVDAAIEAGKELTPSLVAQTAGRIMAAERNRSSAMIAAQSKDNTQYAKDNKVKSDGVAAITPPKPLNEMSRQERNAFTRKLAENARAKREADS